MIPEYLIRLLIEVPILGVFVWYTLTSSTKYLESLDKRDDAFERRTKALIDSINTNNRAILDSLSELKRENTEHDNYVRATLDRKMRQRSKVGDG